MVSLDTDSVAYRALQDAEGAPKAYAGHSITAPNPAWRWHTVMREVDAITNKRNIAQSKDIYIALVRRYQLSFRNRHARPWVQEKWSHITELLDIGTDTTDSSLKHPLEACILRGDSMARIRNTLLPGIDDAWFTLYKKIFFDVDEHKHLIYWVQKYVFDPYIGLKSTRGLWARVAAYYGGKDSFCSEVLGMSDTLAAEKLVRNIFNGERMKQLLRYSADERDSRYTLSVEALNTDAERRFAPKEEKQAGLGADDLFGVVERNIMMVGKLHKLQSQPLGNNISAVEYCPSAEFQDGYLKSKGLLMSDRTVEATRETTNG